MTKEQIHRLKIKLCKTFHLKDIPSNSDIIAHIPTSYSDIEKEKLIRLLQRKPMRTISGVAIIAIMTSPEICPHGTCLPCPGGPEYESPQSYTGFEPAAMRAKMNEFDPYLQVKARLNQIEIIGHPTDKIDLIIMGGTFTGRTPWYQEWFVKRCFDAMNKVDSLSLDDAKKLNETADHRCIGLTIETRPDWFRLHQVDNSLFYGATRVELGVQTVFDDVLHIMQRGHTVSDTISATRIAKNVGLKICYHMMPGLPGSDKKRDIDAFKTIFSDPNFKPDMLKIYPTLVIEGTPLYDMWKNKEYEPLSTRESQMLIADVMSFVPEWVRIQRIQRDVPAQYINSGVLKSNLRQLVDDELNSQGIGTHEIRSREIGHQKNQKIEEFENLDVRIHSVEYEASDSSEVFISLITKHKYLVGYLRLREILSSHRRELHDKSCMMIRELRVVGKEVGIGKQKSDGLQHKGFGSQLLKEAEKISKEKFNQKYLYVLSGVGVKQYYRSYHNFKDQCIYLYKKL